MPTNNFPNIGFTNLGYDKNYFQKVTCTWTTYGGGSTTLVQPDYLITFQTQGIIIANEDASAVIRVSYNGNTDHLELNPSIIKAVVLDNIIASKIFIRLVSGSSAVVSVAAWAK